MLGKYIVLISISLCAGGYSESELNIPPKESGRNFYQPIYITTNVQPQGSLAEQPSVEKPAEDKIEDILTRWKITMDYQLNAMKKNITDNINQNIDLKIDMMEIKIQNQLDKLNEVINNISRVVENKSNVKSEYKTVYACESKILEIACERGLVINLIWANYGRLSLDMCNDKDHQWITNCTTSKGILNERCHMRQNCSVAATNSNFGDPCVSTEKYLEAYYQCVPDYDNIW